MSRSNGRKDVRTKKNSIANPVVPYLLPPGWLWARFGDVTINRDGERIPVEKSVRQGRHGIYDYYGASGVIDKIDAYLFDKPLLLIGEDGANLINRSTPVAFIATGKYWVNNHAHVLDSVSVECLQYLEIFVNAVDLRPYITGTAQPKMNQAKMNSMLVALAPEEEQKRIVRKVNELMGLCDELEARQQAKRESRVRLNTAILAPLNNAASLTTEEFAQATTCLADNFDTLYDSIDTVRKLRSTILQLAVQGKLVRRRNENKPENGSRVSDYVRVLNGYAFKSEWFVSYGIRLLRNTNIGHGSIHWREVACINKDRANEFAKFALDDGDIVISLDRPLISTGLKVARISKKDVPSLLLQRVGKVQLKNNELDTDYFFMWLNSPAFVDAIDPGRSNGVPHISSKSIEAIPFAPPLLTEQKRIVAKVNQLLSLCDDLETKLRQAEADSEKLMNAAVKHVLDSVRNVSNTAEEVFA